MANTIEGVASPQSNYEKYKDMFTDKHDLITMDNFYSLLVAEMQNQDPLEPTSNTEFISQMASFTALSAQQDSFEVQQQNYANSLIGKTVTVSTGDGNTETGVVAFVKSGDTPQINVNGTNYNLSAIAQVRDDSTSGAAGIGDYGAFAAGILGKTAVVQSMDAMGNTYIDEGRVDSLEIEKGNVRVIVNGYAYDATDIVKVSESAAAQTSAPDDDDYEAAETAAAPVTPAAAQTPVQPPVQTPAATEEEAVSTADVTRIPAAVSTDDEDIEDYEDNNDIYELFE